METSKLVFHSDISKDLKEKLVGEFPGLVFSGRHACQKPTCIRRASSASHDLRFLIVVNVFLDVPKVVFLFARPTFFSTILMFTVEY